MNTIHTCVYCNNAIPTEDGIILVLGLYTAHMTAFLTLDEARELAKALNAAMDKHMTLAPCTSKV